MSHKTETDAAWRGRRQLIQEYDDDVPREEINKEEINKAINIASHGLGSYKEGKYEFVDEHEYPRTRSDPGLVVIFNYENFTTDHTKRTGTKKDVEELIITLGRLKFNIDGNYIFTDLTKAQTEQQIQKIAAMDLSTRNCLICIFLSHGYTDNTIFTSDGQFHDKDIYEPLAKIKSLEGQPKLFIFQACKGEFPESNEDSPKVSPLVPSSILKLNIPDILLFYSTLEGEVSFREQYGTWFIQEICRNFTAYGRIEDVTKLVMRTIKCVSSSYAYEDARADAFDRNVHRIKQLPIFISTLRKQFYLTMSHERQFKLKLKHDIDIMHETLKRVLENGTSALTKS